MIKNAKIQQLLLKEIQYFNATLYQERKPLRRCKDCTMFAFTPGFERKSRIRYTGKCVACSTKSNYLEDGIEFKPSSNHTGCAPIIGAYLAYILKNLPKGALTVND